MQKLDSKSSPQERINSMPSYKTDFVNQNQHQNRIHKVQKVQANKPNDELSLLIANKTRESLKKLDFWQLTDDHKMIYREFILKDFLTAIDLIDRIALIAEDEKHHPDIHLTKYRNLRIGLTTHEVGGLSDKDFIVAKRINDLPVLIKAVPVAQQLKNKKQANKGSSDIKNKPKQKTSVIHKKTKVLVNKK